MGKVEKIAVLSVLFLIALILVVSMSTDNPIDTANAAVLGEKPSVASPASSEVTPDTGKNLLSATVTGEASSGAAAAPAPSVPQPLAIPTGSLLKTTEGLSEGYDSQRFLYTWQSGDSYVALAKKLYGEPTKFTLIQNANEGREGIQAGEKILVPVYDVEAAVEAEAPKAEKPAAKKKPAADVAKSTVPSALGRSHTVKKGESLWKIAKAELGDANRWGEIYELNKDKLKSPEALRDGMQLRLP
jgi:nucleoid-associated protein YgaU